jgi:hypothetical protein
LRATGNHVILAETSNTWKKIKSHRRLPDYMNKPLPWTLNEILRDLETANITTLHLPSSHMDIIKGNQFINLIRETTNHHQGLPLKNKTSVFFATTNTQTHGILQNNVLSKIPL